MVCRYNHATLITKHILCVGRKELCTSVWAKWFYLPHFKLPTGHHYDLTQNKTMRQCSNNMRILKTVCVRDTKRETDETQAKYDWCNHFSTLMAVLRVTRQATPLCCTPKASSRSPALCGAEDPAWQCTPWNLTPPVSKTQRTVMQLYESKGFSYRVYKSYLDETGVDIVGVIFGGSEGELHPAVVD